MQAEKTYHYVGHYGIAFDVREFTIQPGECCHIRTLSLPYALKLRHQILEKAQELYVRMLPGQRPCRMRVVVSRALERQQADLLNEQRITLFTLIGAAVGKAAGSVVANGAGTLAGAAVGTVAGTAASWLIKGKIPTFHGGDVLVALEAWVDGGIGPQHTTVMMIL
ncbi:TPA: glycine zipper family protein [Pseudomonas putida]